eukprot:GHUV01015025.1.p1 GENE.GHUV01015025.1~~GHUV01015025.1.p1  ORF type:complete len:140 (+),score=26.53 GHUV01015025.1:2048-2467(+)
MHDPVSGSCEHIYAAAAIHQVPRWDTSKLRAKGTRLKTFGGRASGPEPLEALFLFAVNLFKGARGRRLTPLEAHDLVCKVAEIVVVGGVRRYGLGLDSAVLTEPLNWLHDGVLGTCTRACKLLAMCGGSECQYAASRPM